MKEYTMLEIKLRIKGMALILAIVALFLLSAFFATVISRLRQENVLTNRNSINERLYHLASSIGRIVSRKIQKDIETREPTISKKIFEAVFKTGETKVENLVKVNDLLDLDVIKEIKKEFTNKWGKDFSVNIHTILNIGNASPFPSEYPGLQNSPFERKGSLDVIVSVEQFGIKKVCKISKEFLLTWLFAPPFHKFTLFARRGAELEEDKVNRLDNIDEEGKVISGKPPLIIFNRLIRNKQLNNSEKDSLDATQNKSNAIIRDKSDLIHNGWIYLGGSSNKQLILNICAGAEKDFYKNGVGEFFHFYFDNQTKGWLLSKQWNDWLDNQVPANVQPDGNRLFNIVFVDYGIFPGLKNITFNNYPLFEQAINTYQGVGRKDLLTKGNALHLFGTPSLCTPTLVFGNVRRRYIRTFGFYFTNANRVYPLRGMTNSEFNNFYKNELEPWGLARNVQIPILSLIEDLISNSILNYNLYWRGDGGQLCRLAPQFREKEPYILSLKNIIRPNDVSIDWKNAIPSNDYCGENPERICVSDFEFNNDPHIHYTGKLSMLGYNKRYLKSKISYFISDNKPIKLSECDFFLSKFTTKVGNTYNLFLNQIIGFDSDLDIDIPLNVIKGGVIYAKGKIKITQPITNIYLSQNFPSNGTPDCFGYVTLISDSNIEISYGGNTNVTLSQLPQLHAFLVCFKPDETGTVTLNAPVHIIGGIAVDRIDSLVENGGIIEYGFERAEIADNLDLTTVDFYGLAMGPQDYEIVYEE